MQTLTRAAERAVLWEFVKFRNFAAPGAFLESKRVEGELFTLESRLPRMSTGLRYDLCMRRVVPIVLAVVGVMTVPTAGAQINGTRASVTSLGGSPIFPPGPRASVTSLGPQGFTPNFNGRNCCFSFRPKNPHHSGLGGGRFGFGVGVLPLYSMPYYYGYGDVVDPVDDSMEQSYSRVADRQKVDRESTSQQQYYDDERLNRLEAQMDEMENAPKKSEPVQTHPQAPVADQPGTVLVFRDGHSVEVTNYAIVGDTIYDFSQGSRHKIALADLDLSATEKQNDARGLDFRLPTRPLGN